MTTTQIAKKLGISRGTVSRVINGQPNVNAQTRQRVLQALADYGYQPNEAARSLVMQRKLRIAVIVFSAPQFFWEQVRFGVNTAAQSLAASGLRCDYFVTDILKPEQQLDLLRRLPQEGYDAIALAPNDASMLTEEIDALAARNVPVLLLNVDAPQTQRLCYVGCDYGRVGELAGELAHRMTPPGMDACVLALQDPVVSIDQRVAGFRRMLAQMGGPGIARELRFSRMAEGVYEATLALLRQDENVGALYVALGALAEAARAVADAGRAGKLCLIGHDMSREIFDQLQSGAITATIGHEPFNQGFYAVKLLGNFLMTREPPAHSIFYCKPEVILRANAQYYLNQVEQLELLNL